MKRDTASRLIQIGFSSHNPEFAAQVTNTVVQTFIEDTFQTRHNAIMKSSEWLSRQLDDIRAKMETSSKALADYQAIGWHRRRGDGDKSTYTEHMGELSRQYTTAESDRIQIQSLLHNMQNGDPDSLPEVRNNPVVQTLSSRLAEQRGELAQTLVVYGKNHPTAKKLQSQVDELQSQLDGQKKAIVNSYKASYAAAEARERLMAAEMKGTTKEMGQMARYTALKKEVQTEVELYNSLYAKIKEAGIAAASKSANIRVVDAARAPETPASPTRVLNLCVGLLAALLGGVALAFICEELDNKLHSPEDIRRWIGNSNVSIIPVIGESERNEERLTWPQRMAGLLPSSATTEEPQTNTFFLERPNSPEGEAVQALYASIMLSGPGQCTARSADRFVLPWRRQDHGRAEPLLCPGQAGQDLPGGCRPAQRPAGTRFQPECDSGIGRRTDRIRHARSRFARSPRTEQSVDPAGGNLDRKRRPAPVLGDHAAGPAGTAATLSIRGH